MNEKSLTKRQLYERDYYQSHKEKYKERGRKWEWEHKGNAIERMRKHRLNLTPQQKKQIKAKVRKNYQENKEQEQEKARKWRWCHRTEIKGYSRKYYQDHRETEIERIKKNRQENMERVNEIQMKSYWKHKEQRDESSRKWKQEHKEQCRLSFKRWKKTEGGRKKICVMMAKRRNKKWIEILPNIFPEEISVDYHHVDGKIFVVPLPRKLHLKVIGFKIKEHIGHANDWIEFYYGVNPVNIISEPKFNVLRGEGFSPLSYEH